MGPDDVEGVFLSGVTSMDAVAREEPVNVVVRRIGEPVQVDSEALGLLTAAGLLPGVEAVVRRDGNRVVLHRLGASEASGVSLPDALASHVFVVRP